MGVLVVSAETRRAEQGKFGALARARQQSVYCGMGISNIGQHVRGRVWVAHTASNKSMGTMGTRVCGAVCS